MCIGHVGPVIQGLLEGIFSFGQSSFLSQNVAKVSQGCKEKMASIMASVYYAN